MAPLRARLSHGGRLQSFGKISVVGGHVVCKCAKHTTCSTTLVSRAKTDNDTLLTWLYSAEEWNTYDELQAATAKHAEL